MGFRDLFREIGRSTDDMLSGKGRLHTTSLSCFGPSGDFLAADVVIPTSGLEYDLVNFATFSALDNVFARVTEACPSHTSPSDAKWASSWFIDPEWSPVHLLRYAIFPFVDRHWWHLEDSAANICYATGAGHHPFGFLHISVELGAAPVKPWNYNSVVGLAVALDMRAWGQTRRPPRVLWLADPNVLLGSYGLELKTPLPSPEHAQRALGGHISYYAEQPFEGWPHRMLVEPPPAE